MKGEWDGKTERREYCAMHCRVAQDVKSATPWRFTVVLISIIGLLLGGLFTWHSQEMAELRQNFEQFNVEVDAKLISIETQAYQKVSLLSNSNKENFERLFSKLNALSIDLGELKTRGEVIREKQEMILKKIKITE